MKLLDESVVLDDRQYEWTREQLGVPEDATDYATMTPITGDRFRLLFSHLDKRAFSKGPPAAFPLLAMHFESDTGVRFVLFAELCPYNKQRFLWHPNDWNAKV